MKIVIGLSGGVDSSVAAHLLREAGHELIGCTMRSFDTERSRREAADAAAVAERLGIPFEEIDYREAFKREVISYFIREYTAGRTPNPCCLCNRKVKWEALLACARAHGADAVATGHYASVFAGAGRYCIRQAKTLAKDQSYALYNLTQEQLSRTVMPLGAYTKDEVRKLAAEIGLFTAEKPDSQEICFIPDQDYAGFIGRNIGLLEETGDGELSSEASGSGIAWDQPGNFVDSSGRVLGRHEGIIHYTIGQRKGLGIALGKRIFVKEIRPLKNEVVLADNEEVFSAELFCGAVNWQRADGCALPLRARVRIRYAHAGAEAVIEESGRRDGAGGIVYRVCFSEPVRAVTPGQAAVFYDEEGCVLGGGLILQAVSDS